jgi:hypothetical protein
MKICCVDCKVTLIYRTTEDDVLLEEHYGFRQYIL